MDEPERDVVSHELPEEREFGLETRPASGRSSPGRCAASSRIQREHLQLSSSDEQLTMTSAAGELAKFDWRPMAAADGRALGDAKNDLGGIPRTTGTRNPGAEVGRAVLGPYGKLVGSGRMYGAAVETSCSPPLTLELV